VSTSFLSPASGAVRPPRSPAAAFGLWYATRPPGGSADGGPLFASFAGVEAAVAHGLVAVFAPVRVRREGLAPVATTVGRVLLARAVRVTLPFALLDRTLDVHARAHLLEVCADRLGVHAAERLEVDLDGFGLAFAARSGASLAADDLRAPPSKPDLLGAAAAAVQQAERRYRDGEITDGERYHLVMEAWGRAVEALGEAFERGASGDRPLGALLAAGVVPPGEARRGVAVGGLATRPNGETLELPVAHSFAEGLTPHEHFLTASMARTQAVSRFSRDESAAALRRRLLAALGELRVTEIDCGACAGRTLRPLVRARRVVAHLAERALGRTALGDVWSEGEHLVRDGEAISRAAAESLHEHVVPSVAVRSVLDCTARGGVCQRCYGLDPRTRRPPIVGARIGLLAAETVAEVGRELAHHTFHVCGLTPPRTGDATSWSGVVRSGRLDAIAGPPYEPTRFRPGDATTCAGVLRWCRLDAEPGAGGEGFVVMRDGGRLDLLDPTGRALESFAVRQGDLVLVPDGARVPAVTRLVGYPWFDAWSRREEEARSGLPGLLDLLDAPRASPRALLAEIAGVVRVVEARPHPRYGALLRVDPALGGRPGYCRIPRDRDAMVNDGEHVVAGQALTDGSRDHRDLRRVLGPRLFADHLLGELVALFVDSGGPLVEPHLEIVVRAISGRALPQLPAAGAPSASRASALPSSRTLSHDRRTSAPSDS